MKKVPSGFESELRVSLQPVLVSMILASVGVFLFSIAPDDLVRNTMMMVYVVLMGVVAWIAWTLESGKLLLARWVAVGGIVRMILLADYWFRFPEILVLLAIPVGTAAILIGFPAGTLVASVCSGYLAFFQAKTVIISRPLLVIMELSMLWFILGMAYVLYRSAYRLLQWSWSCYQRANVLIKETRDLATCLVRMAEYVESGKEFYSLADASQDHYLNLMAEKAIETGMPIETKKMPWVE